MQASFNRPMKMSGSNVVCLQCVRISKAFLPDGKPPYVCQGYCGKPEIKPTKWDRFKAWWDSYGFKRRAPGEPRKEWLNWKRTPED